VNTIPYVKRNDSEKPIQAMIRDLLVQHSGTWFPGMSRAYKNRSQNGSIYIKVKDINVPRKQIKALEQALSKLPKVNQVQVYDRDLHVWFDEEPGVGPKINQSAYNQRLETSAKGLRGLLIASGKSKNDVLADLAKIL
jgi:dienelactone hydrolase